VVPELWAAPDDLESDVVISEGAVPHDLGPTATRTASYQVDGERTLMIVPSVARYLVQNGRRLTVDADPGADPDVVKLYLKGGALASLVHQRGQFPLHASAIEYEGECVLFLGDSGAGKSTLVGMLAGRGLRVISDDVVVPLPGADKRMRAEPSIPVLKLWPQSLPVTGFAEHQAPFEAQEHKKHHIDARLVFSESSLPISRLYFFRWMHPSSAEPEFPALTPFEAMLRLRNQVYRSELIVAGGREREFVAFSAALMSAVRAYDFCRPCNIDRAPAQVDALLAHLRT
jgi:hypothetical protein